MKLTSLLRKPVAPKRLRRPKPAVRRLFDSFGPRSQLAAAAGLIVVGGWYYEAAGQYRPEPPHTLGAVFQREAKLMPERKVALPAEEPVPAVYRVPTAEPVVFLTIDDGKDKNQAAAEYMHQKGLVASLFLNDSEAAEDYGYFSRLVAAGSAIENHGVNHLYLNRLDYGQQKREICTNADRFEQEYGRRPRFLRPPYGEYDRFTRQAARECGMQALVMWSASVNNGIVTYRYPGGRLQPGDIILLHFRPTMVQDLKGAEAEIAKAGLQIGLLEEWLE